MQNYEWNLDFFQKMQKKLIQEIKETMLLNFFLVSFWDSKIVLEIDQ